MLKSPIPLNFFGSYRVGIGKFNLLFLWLIGAVRQTAAVIQDKKAGLTGYANS